MSALRKSRLKLGPIVPLRTTALDLCNTFNMRRTFFIAVPIKVSEPQPLHPLSLKPVYIRTYAQTPCSTKKRAWKISFSSHFDRVRSIAALWTFHGLYIQAAHSSRGPQRVFFIREILHLKRINCILIRDVSKSCFK